MKRQVKIATLLVAGMTILSACNNGGMSGFKTTDGGLHYRFDKQNKDGQQVQEGDVLVGEMTLKFDTTVPAPTAMPNAYCKPRPASAAASTKASS